MFRYRLDVSNLDSGATETLQTSFTPGMDLTDGTHTLYVQERDAAGNWSVNGQASILLDLVPPTVPVLHNVAPISPANENMPLILGTAEMGSLVKVYGDAGCSGAILSQGTAEELSTQGLVVPVMDDSINEWFATATDAVGNVSACSQPGLVYVEDSTPPPPVVFSSSTPPSPSYNTAPLIRGVAEAGSTVQLFTNPQCTGGAVTQGSAEAFAAPGLEVQVAENLATTFYATATDAVGNVNACSTSSLTYVHSSTISPYCDPANPDILMCFTFDSIVGSTVLDQSQHHQDATVSNLQLASGPNGNHAVCSATTSITVPESGVLSTTEATVEAWVRVDVLPTVGRQGILDSDGRYGLFVHPGTSGPGRGDIWCLQGSSVVKAQDAVSAGVWVYVACAIGTNVTLYVDGEARNQVPRLEPISSWSSGSSLCANTPPSDQLLGALDCVRIINKERTPPQIIMDMACTP